MVTALVAGMRLVAMPVLEVGDDGMLHVPGEFLAGAQPHAQFELDILGNVMLLRPAGVERPLWRQATRAERADAFQRWAETSPPDSPDLPTESLRREGLYD
jgi:hypothetical protein